MNSPLLNIEQTAVYLNSNKATIYILVRRPTFPAFKIGREWKIHKMELDKWIALQLQEKLTV